MRRSRSRRGVKIQREKILYALEHLPDGGVVLTVMGKRGAPLRLTRPMALQLAAFLSQTS